MEYMKGLLDTHTSTDKEDIVLFPHRVAPEKQVDIFKDLAGSFPDTDFIVCQDQKLTKDEYHDLLGKAKAVFSANTQETLGISCYEGAIVGAQPIVPARLSYTEMYDDYFKYPSAWTEDWDSYLTHKDKIVEYMQSVLAPSNERDKRIQDLESNLRKEFFSGEKLYKIIRGHTSE
jgi:hypothetical protein